MRGPKFPMDLYADSEHARIEEEKYLLKLDQTIHMLQKLRWRDENDRPAVREQMIDYPWRHKLNDVANDAEEWILKEVG